MKKVFISVVSALLLTSAFGEDVCIQVITPAKNPTTGECVNYPTPCDVPEGWELVDLCDTQDSGEVIKVKSDWDLLGSLKDINDMSIFDVDCFEQLWVYDGDKKVWSNYDKKPYMSDYARISEIKAGRGFWIKGTSDCDIKVATSGINLNEIDIAGKTITYSSTEKGNFTETYYANGTMESSLLKDINMSWSIVDGKLQGKSEETLTAIPAFKFLSEPKVGTKVEADFYGELNITAISDNIFTNENTNILLDSDSFYIKMESNPTTGYSWSVSSYDETLFNTPINSYLTMTQTNMVGSGGYEYLFFKLKDNVTLTENTITLDYARSWEATSLMTTTFKVSPIRNFTKDDGEIYLNKDEYAFNIQLDSNPTTGYSWKVLDYNESIFFEPTDSYVVDSNLIGSGGVDTWHFKLKDINLPENTTIKMQYAQPWEGGNSDEPIEFKLYFPANSYDIDFNKTLNIDNGKLIVKFEDISDSRCATGVQCIVAGDVNVTLGITGMLEIYEIQSFKLNETKTNAQGYSVTLKDVQPYPLVDTPIDKANYTATIEIKKPE